MNVSANPKESARRWNLNFWRLEQFSANFRSKRVVDTSFKPLTISKQTTNKRDSLTSRKVVGAVWTRLIIVVAASVCASLAVGEYMPCGRVSPM